MTALTLPRLPPSLPCSLAAIADQRPGRRSQVQGPAPLRRPTTMTGGRGIIRPEVAADAVRSDRLRGHSALLAARPRRALGAGRAGRATPFRGAPADLQGG